MSQTDSHDPSQGELSGEVTNRLLMDMPQSPRRTQNRVLTFVGVVVFFLAVGGIAFGLYWLLPSGETGGVFHPDLSYHEYKRKISTKEVDPNGASHIYYLRQDAPAGAEGYDLWMKMRIPENSYETMLNRQQRRIRDMQSRENAKVEPKSSRTITIPNWQQHSEAESPLWWGEIESVRSANSRCNTWDIQVRGKDRGMLWAYDPARETLWIWEWEAPAGRGSGSTGGTRPAANDGANPAEEATPGDTSNPGEDSDPNSGSGAGNGDSVTTPPATNE